MLEQTIENPKNIIKKGKNIFLIGLASLVLYYTTGCENKYDLSTPQQAFNEYVEIIKNDDYEALLKNYGFNEREIEKIIRETDKKDIFEKQLDESIERTLYAIVDVKYCIKDGEEIALVRVVLTDQQTDNKGMFYYRFANEKGKWVFVDRIKPLIQCDVEIYSESTIKSKSHKSKILGKLREYILKMAERSYQEKQDTIERRFVEPDAKKVKRELKGIDRLIRESEEEDNPQKEEKLDLKIVDRKIADLFCSAHQGVFDGRNLVKKDKLLEAKECYKRAYVTLEQALDQIQQLNKLYPEIKKYSIWEKEAIQELQELKEKLER